MKDILVLLVLLNVRTTMVCSKAYPPDSAGKCEDPTGKYLSEISNLCCKRCPPAQYMEGRNYSPNCRSCKRCREDKGLQYAVNCTATVNSKCQCQPGKYCTLGFEDPYCDECSFYSRCKAGYGVSEPGTADTNVRCKRCPNGTFSDTDSSTDPCLPHTNCHGRAVVRKGNATSNTVCEPELTGPQSSPKDIHLEVVLTSARMTSTMSTMSTMSNIAATSDSKAPGGPTDATPSINLTLPETVFNHSTKSPPRSTHLPAESESKLAAVIATVTGLILLFIVIMLVCLWKTVCKKDAALFYPKVDANGNCEAGDEQNKESISGETQLISFTLAPPEQQLLLEKGEAFNDQSQRTNNTESLTRTCGCSSEESIGPLQSTTCLHEPHSALSEPLPLLSNTDPDSSQTSIAAQASQQPTATTSPQVNVNITFNIGNGSAGTPSVMPADLMQPDCKLPFGEEEKSLNIPQQEAGKTTVMSVQESVSHSI
ncbi:tumor necrosis factor receptor superfamily member 1B isoform X2 [Labrus bergylta]|uniref:tumor necrosis factor receptor superfamily member 1B isoform X2 n=1 Tax=Labrus bergylta TaxID=56723 RepID=UPI0009B3BEF6|nr:tumor necrosis factor receptor superfamily member 1B-like isoform X2 [Labrus bergylta]